MLTVLNMFIICGPTSNYNYNINCKLHYFLGIALAIVVLIVNPHIYFILLIKNKLRKIYTRFTVHGKSKHTSDIHNRKGLFLV